MNKATLLEHMCTGPAIGPSVASCQVACLTSLFHIYGCSHFPILKRLTPLGKFIEQIFKEVDGLRRIIHG